MKKKGFTLIELVVVMAIIAVLAVIIIGAIVVARNTATETTNRTNANILRTGLEQYYSRYKAYCGADAATPQVTCTTNYTFTSLATALNAAGITVTLNTTTSATGGGLVVTTSNGSTAGPLTTAGAFLAPYSSSGTAMPTINLP
jgi:prepilin-type N-terminal cleavage/methylation domain-containing protein